MDKIKKFFAESKTRIFTALGLIGLIFLLAVIDSSFLTWALLGIIYLISMYETCKLLGIDDTRFYAIAIALWVLCGWYTSPLILACVTLVILVSVMLQYGEFNAKSLIPFIYPTIPMVIFLSVYTYFGMFSVVWLIFIIAPTDIGAYIVGKFYGKRKFSALSPNKTWEGVIGGIVAGGIVGTFCGLYAFDFLFSLAASLSVSAASIWGDLFESYLKREAKVKDSGKVFPGHGGVLDRVDGYFFGVVILYAFLEGVV